MAERRTSRLREVAGEGITSKISPILALCFETTLFLSLASSNVDFNGLSRTTKFRTVSFYIFNFIFIVSKSSCRFLLVIQMGENFIITPQFEILALLNTIHGIAVKSERILKGYVWR